MASELYMHDELRKLFPTESETALRTVILKINTQLPNITTEEFDEIIKKVKDSKRKCMKNVLQGVTLAVSGVINTIPEGMSEFSGELEKQVDNGEYDDLIEAIDKSENPFAKLIFMLFGNFVESVKNAPINRDLRK